LLKDVLSTRDDKSEMMFADSSGLQFSHLKLSYIKCSDESYMTIAIFLGFRVCYCTNSYRYIVLGMLYYLFFYFFVL